MQFIETARQLEIYTIKHCSRFAKHYMFFITKHLVELSHEILDNAKSANSVFPKNAEENQLRVNYVIKAICAVEALLSQLDVAIEFVGEAKNDKPIKPTVWEEWTRYCMEELKVLKGIKKTYENWQ